MCSAPVITGLQRPPQSSAVKPFDRARPLFCVRPECRQLRLESRAVIVRPSRATSLCQQASCPSAVKMRHSTLEIGLAVAIIATMRLGGLSGTSCIVNEYDGDAQARWGTTHPLKVSQPPLLPRGASAAVVIARQGAHLRVQRSRGSSSSTTKMIGHGHRIIKFVCATLLSTPLSPPKHGCQAVLCDNKPHVVGAATRVRQILYLLSAT